MDERGIITDERDLYEKKLKALTLAMGSTENQNIDLEKKVNGMEHTIECAIEAVRSLLKTVDLCNKYVPNPLYGHIRILITTFNANFSKMMPEGELPAEQPATSD
jgi:acetylglutamate kinase